MKKLWLVGSVSLFVIGGAFVASFFNYFLSSYLCWNLNYVTNTFCAFGYRDLGIGIGLIIAGVVIAVKAKN